MKTIPSTSYSRLSIFEKCPRRAELQYALKIPEPEEPDDSARNRGTRIHDELESFVRGMAPLPPEAAAFEEPLQALQENLDNVELEQMWCFNQQWQVVDDKDFKNTWMRIKLDVMLHVDDAHAIVVDYKTGKRWGNEVSHADQHMLYALGAVNRYPYLEHITTEFWYIDQKDLTRLTWRRHQLMGHFLERVTQRHRKMTAANAFPAKPSFGNCKYCPYKTGQIGKGPLQGTGHCDLNPD